jgi:hypothetical protein
VRLFGRLSSLRQIIRALSASVVPGAWGGMLGVLLW